MGDDHWLCSAATLRGDRATNQDQVVIVDGACAVLDGATSWLRDPADPRDGGWYARALGGALAQLLPGVGRSLAEVLADAIADIRDTYALTPGDSPYSTASIIRWTQDEVEVLVLGDSPVVVLAASGSTAVVSDERLSVTATGERAAYRGHLADGAGFDPAFAELIAAVQRAERAAFNVPDGFWVAEADPSAAEHAVTRSWRPEEVTAVALLTDGAAAAVDYALATWPDVIPQVVERGAGSWLQSIHALEETDPDGVRWPRTKQHDDKSVVVVDRRVPRR